MIHSLISFLISCMITPAEKQGAAVRFITRHLFVFVMIMALLLESLHSVRAEASPGVILEEELNELFNRYVTENTLDPELISVAYVYTATGETWYHLEDRWYYSASLYKVPLMMLLTEKEYEGELTRGSELCGMTLEAVEEEVLVNSDNDLAYSAMLYLAQPDVCRRMFCRYSDLSEDYYTWDFYGGSYFTARYMTDVMYSLFREPERFPRVIDCLKRAQPGHYFHLKLGDRVEIAQKYGTYRDEDEADWNHAAGIFYTPNPFILTVMTRYGGISETILGDLAELFCEYTLQMDERLKAARESSGTPAADRDEKDTFPASENTAAEDGMEPAQKPDVIPNQFEESQAAAEHTHSEELLPEESGESEPVGLSGRLMTIAVCLTAELLLVLLWGLRRSTR